MHTSDKSTLLDMVKRRDNLSSNIRFMCSAFSWRELADIGLKVEAIMRYRDEVQVDSLANAKANVEAYIASKEIA